MKKSLVIALALMLVLAFATSAMAAQAIGGTPSSENPAGYLSTTATGVYSQAESSLINGFTRLNSANKFTVDGYTYYPYEIYLPNEESPSSYRIHSNYAKNTDACASCHATHTAVGDSLLQWYTVYETCMACHDGTLGSATYNVEGGEIGTTGTPAFGGMFGTGTEGSLSNHNVTGSMDIAAAPGGSTEEEKVGDKTRWTVEFGCQSCHTPHGNGGNARILHPDANFAATAAADAVTTGYQIINKAVGAVVYNAAGTTPLYILKGYPYSYTVKNGATPVAATIDNSLGFSVVTGANSATDRVYGTPALQVKMSISGYLTSGENVQHVSGMNAYCGACHTDYNTEGTFFPSDTLSGTYTQAHRHKVGSSVYLVSGTEAGYGNSLADIQASGLKFESNNLECLTCHVAHGVSADYWAETLNGASFTADGTAWDADPDNAMYTELAGSSALKRMPNMGTCEACHQKGDSAEGYNANAGISAPAGAPASLNPVYNFSFFLGDTVTGDFNYVGSATCAKCHADIYAEWTSGVDHGHVYTKTFKATRKAGDPAGQGICGDGSGEVTGIGNVKFGCHGIGSQLAFANAGLADTNPVSGKVYWATTNASVYAAKVAAMPTFKEGGADAGITCEVCHGSGINHAKAPSAKNIFNPGNAQVGTLSKQDTAVLSCVKCHGALNQIESATTGDILHLSNNSTQADIIDAGNKPEVHAGITGYTASKHYDEGIAACTTCHNPHASSYTSETTKLEYGQLCASCHDNAGTIAQTMGNKFNHSFEFGMTGETVTDAAYVYVAFRNNAQLGNTTTTAALATTMLAQSKVVKPMTINLTQADDETFYETNTGSWYLSVKPSTAVEGVDYKFNPVNAALTYLKGGNANNLKGTWKIKYVNDAVPSATNISSKLQLAPATTSTLDEITLWQVN